MDAATEYLPEPANLPPRATPADESAIAIVRFCSDYAVLTFRDFTDTDGCRVRYSRGSGVMISYIEGETAEAMVKRIARTYVKLTGRSRGFVRCRQGGCELPNKGYARFGWTRETRGVGAVSIIPDIYLVF